MITSKENSAVLVDIVLLGQVRQYFAYESQHQHGVRSTRPVDSNMFGIFTPISGEMIQFDDRIFQMGPTKLSIGCTTQALRNCLDLRARTGQGRKFRSAGWGWWRNRLIGTVGSWWKDFCTSWYWRIFGTMIVFQSILIFMVLYNS